MASRGLTSEFDFIKTQITDSSSLESIELWDLIRRSQTGDIEARNALVTTHLKLILRFVLHINKNSSRIPMEDAFQLGVIGFMGAIGHFDLDGGGNFFRYAYTAIRYTIISGLRTSNVIAVPLNAKKRHTRTAERALKAREVVTSDCSLVPCRGETNPAVIVAEQERRERDVIRVRSWLGCLSERQEEIIRARYGLDNQELYQKDIAPLMEISQCRVHQIEHEALDRLRFEAEQEQRLGSLAAEQRRRPEIRRDTSRYKGVFRDQRGRWRATLYMASKKIFLGCHDTEEDAARAYDVVARKMGKPTNFPDRD